MAEQAQIIRWEHPPPAQRTVHGHGSVGSRYDHLAATLRDRPREWALIREAVNRNVANSVAGQIREARMRCFEPRGDFDACTRTAGDSMVRVYARYVGDWSES